ncbi:hypothetical protein Tco_0554755 [Tanacetum coccineum]
MALQDETVIKEWEDRMERAATTASSLEAKHDSGGKERDFWKITPLFQAMMVQALEEVGEGLAVPTDSRHTTTQPSTSRP